MKRFNRFAVLAAFAASVVTANAQIGWGDFCIDPENTDPRTDDHFSRSIFNDFMIHSVGTAGSVTYGGQNGPCYAPSARTLDLAGRLGFQIGPVGSVQTDFDDFMALTVGMPRDPAGDYCYAMIIKGPTPPLTQVLFGDGGIGGQFVGMSRRYMLTQWADGDVFVQLESRLLGDAVRLRWRMTNISTATQRLGLKFGAYVGMRTANPGVVDNTGHNQANTLLRAQAAIPRPSNIPGANGNIRTGGSVGFIEVPTGRPVRTGKNWLLANPRFPEFVNFQWSQWEPYGIRVDNIPTESTTDATPVDQMLIGSHGTGQFDDLGGIMANNVMRGRVVTDFEPGDPALNPAITNVREDSDMPIHETSFIQVFGAENVAPAGYREVVHYIRSPWSVADYLDPYTALIDAPRLVESSPGDLNDLSPNPFTIAAYLDNQYADVDLEVPLTNVRFTLMLEEGSGLTLAPGESATKTLDTIAPNAIGNVSWQVQADGNAVGSIPYRVRFRPSNSATKELTGRVTVAATPRVRIPEGASLVTIPWTFADTSLDSIFGPPSAPNALRLGQDYLAYRWDPVTAQYLPMVSARRGESIWIVAISDFGQRALNGAGLPADVVAGGQTTTLQPGWNMIGNPYPYAVPLSQLIGVGLTDPTAPLSWSQLVDNGWVSPSLAFWQRDLDNPASGVYRFTSGLHDLLQPGLGYWVFVTTPQSIRISWPQVFLAGLSNTTRRVGESASVAWQQSNRQWRLQLVARNEAGIDSQNFVGVARTSAAAKSLRVFDPPAAPNSNVDLSIRELVDGRPQRLASAFTDSSARKTWTVVARAEEAGDVVLTWPNITTVPRNTRFTLRDVATNTTRDLRFHSSYSFNVDGPTTREFQLTMEPAGAQRALIGNVTVSRPGRDAHGPVVISYTLSTEAMTTVRVLSGGGREIFRFPQSRSASAGENQVTWAMRDSADRAVAPGTYQVEILAETSNGERVRKIVPVNVVR